LNSTAPGSVPATFRRFRLRLFWAIGAVVVVLTGGGLYYAQRNAASGAERDRQREFRAALDRVRSAREMRAAELALRCVAMARKSRIHAALEDDALDLLYLSSRDELGDLMGRGPGTGGDALAQQASFYRFLDAHGAVIIPPDPQDVGILTDEETGLIALPQIPATTQLGYLVRQGPDGADALAEIITTPILSTTLRRPIAALVVGFSHHIITDASGSDAIKRGIWMNGHLELRGLNRTAEEALKAALPRLLTDSAVLAVGTPLDVAGSPHLVLCQPLNIGSVYPIAYEVGLYPLDHDLAQQRRIRWQILGSGLLVLLGALGASHLVAARMSRPVEKLAVESEINAWERMRTQATLDSTQAELQRAARFAANASHQLKTPITVMRAGLDELLARDDLSPAVRDELATLVHATTRFSVVIDDLLLLSRMDADRLRIDFELIDLSHLVASALDDLSVLPDPFGLTITQELALDLGIYGESRYVGHILHNLLENARRYNRPGGRIAVAARTEGRHTLLSIGNTGTSIPAEMQPHIFERFHRGGAGENVPGQGLGLNLARELARLHHGDIRLCRSVNDWTEFEVAFQTTKSAPPFVTTPQ
jgi:signal transduction histidine kinase